MSGDNGERLGDSVQVSISLREGLLKLLDEEAKKQDRPRSYIIGKAVEAYLNKDCLQQAS